MTAATGPEQVARATDAVVGYLTENGLEWDRGSRDGEIVLTLPGEHKQKIVVSLLVRPDHTSVTSFLIRNPDENHEAVYRYLLRRNLRLPGLAYAIDDAGDVFLRGQIPTDALDATRLDEALGVVHQASDTVSVSYTHLDVYKRQAKGRPVEHNAELVSRAAEVAALLQRPPMTPAQAREMLGIKDRRGR